MTTLIDWQDASTATYTADSAVINGVTVEVCLDDEGPLWPAYYWDITLEGARLWDGWAESPAKARRAAVQAAKGRYWEHE